MSSRLLKQSCDAGGGTRRLLLGGGMVAGGCEAVAEVERLGVEGGYGILLST